MSKCNNCCIKEFNAFKTLNKDKLENIASCKVSKTIKKGEILFDEDEFINGIFCIKSGICKISKMNENGREHIIHLAKSGSLIGERSLINNEPTNLKATALNDMQVCFIPKEDIQDSLHNNPDFTLEILKNMASALKHADNTIIDLGQKNVKQRLAHTLLDLEDNFGTDEKGAINVVLTREEIANIIGTATESIIRLLSEFKRKKYINLKGKEICIINRPQLELVIEGA